MKLNHLHLNVADVPAEREFYEKYLGFRVMFEHGKGIFLTNDDKFVMAIDPLEDAEEVERFPPWFHFGYCLKSADAVTTLYREMKEGGVRFNRDLQKFGEDAINFYCKSPGGYNIEVTWNRGDDV